jgi:threonine aldolase
LAGPRDAMREARRHRKLFGGGMRQAGVIGAAALYALEHHVERLAEDHEHAQLLAEAIRPLDGLTLTHEPVETNIVNFDVEPTLGTAAEFAARLEQRGVRILPIGPQSMRAVTHLDVSRAEVVQAGHVLREVVETPVAVAARS